ncbi:hypothetical protein [Orientia tsutsugamushi]|uniref:hypothetical protein n=1 Tax=Orientia tsutsugamushi TaxID=784 RepID=UPI004046A0A9
MISAFIILNYLNQFRKMSNKVVRSHQMRIVKAIQESTDGTKQKLCNVCLPILLAVKQLQLEEYKKPRKKNCWCRWRNMVYTRS